MNLWTNYNYYLKLIAKKLMVESIILCTYITYKLSLLLLNFCNCVFLIFIVMVCSLLAATNWKFASFIFFLKYICFNFSELVDFVLNILVRLTGVWLLRAVFKELPFTATDLESGLFIEKIVVLSAQFAVLSVFCASSNKSSQENPASTESEN